MKSRKFIDSAVLYGEAGSGGDGSSSFRREKFVARGGPDGGDGGHGGSLILRADEETDSLIHIYFQPHRRAVPGGNGRGQKLHGKNGPDLIIPVPCGTEVHTKDTGTFIGDIVTPGQELVVARGGKGGLGNVHWVSSTHQAPREFTPGEPGEVVSLRLDLKLIADAGLVGFPNAGKSSLLTTISDAHPKIAAYPFTTLNPVIGTLIFEDYRRIKVADIPGLITGAHEGVGLGDAFLRHIERSKLIVFVVDMAGVDGRKPHEDFIAVRKELDLYDASITQRPCLVVANKMDLPESKANLKRFRKETGTDPICVSAQMKTGIDVLRAAIQAITRP